MTELLQENLESQLRDLAEQYNESSQWTEPAQFDLADPGDAARLEALIENGSVNSVVDRVENIANDLFDYYFPRDKEDSNSRREYVDSVLSQGSAFGTWFYFPWAEKLVRYPRKEQHRALRTARNRTLITGEEQERLFDGTIAVFGLSVGSSVVERLVMSGVGGKLIMADMDTIEPTNLNRINGPFSDVGSKKIDAIAKRISEADPYIEQVHLPDGVTEDNISAVILSHKPDVLVDEIDDLRMKAVIRTKAKEHSIPLVMATDVADKVLIDVERYDQQEARPFHGRINEQEVQALLTEEISASKRGQFLLKIVGIRNVTPRLIDASMRMDSELNGLPQLGTTASIGGAMATIAIREILLGRRVESGRYICSPKRIMNLAKQEPLRATVNILKSFVESRKNQV